MANTTGLGDTIYAAVRKALEDKNGGSGGSGGGGSSDFTTAHVTVVDSSGGKIGEIAGENCSVCTFSTLEGISATYPVSMLAYGPSIEFDAVLYKGGAYFMYADERAEVESVSGSATKMGEKSVLITGDCTITIKEQGIN